MIELMYGLFYSSYIYIKAKVTSESSIQKVHEL